MVAPTGKTLVGWATSAGGAAAYTPGGNITPTADIKLYAVWLFVYTVTFNKNGGDGTVPNALTWTEGDGALTLPTDSGISPPATGGPFLGWNTQTDGNGTNYSGGASYQPTEDTTLYVHWPTIVTTQEGLAAMASNLSGYYKLADNIAVSNWATVGSMGTTFRGTLDGNGKTITFSGTLTQNAETAGLFGHIDSGGTVKNLNIAGTITVSASGEIYVGAVAGRIGDGGTISNVKSTSIVSASTSSSTIFAGGIVGMPAGSGSISNCYTTGNVTATNTNGQAYAGGIAGLNRTLILISNCYATGEITANGSNSSYAGGIAGYNYGTISYCVALNTSISISSGSAAGRVAGGGSGTFSYNFAVSMTITTNSSPATVNSGSATDKNGANLSDKNTKASWTNGGESGPGWVIADSKAEATETNPWWWSTDGGGHPALYWE
jgi:hypothetical protein